MLIRALKPSERQQPVVVIGTGFGSLFFVHRLLQRRPDMHVLMLERGPFRPWNVQLEENENSAVPASSTFQSVGTAKPWNFTIGYGGGTNCWYGTTPRLHPNDFRLRTLYGRSRDWPISYNDMEPYYVAAEEIMDISGPEDIGIVTPRSRPYPQPPHKFSAADRVMKRAQPARHFVMPTARARVGNAQRPPCCATFRCSLCPVQAKFTALNGFRHITEHPNVRILTDAEVVDVETSDGSRISAVRFRHRSREQRIRCDLCVLGANAIHSAAILLRSGIDHPFTGRGLNEQLGYGIEVLLDGLDNLDGSTITTGANYTLYDGAFRSEHGGAFLVFDNRFPYGIRTEIGRWRQTLAMNVTVEDEPSNENRVTVDSSGNVIVHFHGHSAYAQRGAKRSLDLLAKVLAPLPVEKIVFKGYRPSESHLQGTLRMGRNRADSVVDPSQVHHDIRNLIIVGTSVLPTCPPVAPSLTAAALSLRAADLVVGSAPSW